MQNILFMAIDNPANPTYSGTLFYRLLQPAHKLDQYKLAHVEVANGGQSYEHTIAVMRQCDMIVYSNAASPRMAENFSALRKVGKKIVIDFNDNIFNLSPFNGAYFLLGTKEVNVLMENGNIMKLWEDGKTIDLKANQKRADYQKKILESVDLITVTTAYLAQKFADFGPPVVILPDMIDLQIWKPIKTRYPEPFLRLGWRGGASHFEDILTIKSVIKEIMEKHENIKLVMSGWENARQYLGELPEERIELYPFVGYMAYPWHMMSLGIDIAFNPWKAIEFNQGKNNLAWMEWSAMAVPGIYPGLYYYADVLRHKQTALLALSNQGWQEGIEKLLKDGLFRQTLGEAARKEVEDKWDINKNILLWAQTYQEVSECRSLKSQGQMAAGENGLVAWN